MKVLQRPLSVMGFGNDFLAQIEEVAAKAQLHPEPNGYYAVTQPFTFSVVGGGNWYLRKLKSVNGYGDSGIVIIIGAGTRDLNSVENDPVRIDLRINRNSGSISFTS
jgi:hypothetical protein